MKPQRIYLQKPRQFVASAMFFVLLAFGLRIIIRRGEYPMPEIHTEGGTLMPTGYATVVMGNAASGTVTFTSASGLAADAWVKRG